MEFLFGVYVSVKILIISSYNREISRISSVYRKERNQYRNNILLKLYGGDVVRRNRKTEPLLASVKPRETNQLLQEDNKINISTSVYTGSDNVFINTG